MLNSFDDRSARQLEPISRFEGFSQGDASREDAAASATPPNQGYLTRLYVRRWLLVLFIVIVGALSASYQLPWHATALSILVFAGGTALIPRSGLPIFFRPVASASNAKAGSQQIATTLIGALPEPAILLSPDGTTASFNAKAADLFDGLEPGAHISGAIRNPQVLDAIAACSRAGGAQSVAFNDRVPVDRHMMATVTWLGGGIADTPNILLFIRDLTEQRRLDQLRSDFIANASHEIKTPLTSLLGFIETLQGAARHDEGARDRFLGIMAKQGERMARLIDNLMSLSRIESRAHLRPQDAIQIGELVLQACDALEPMAAEANIQVSVRSELTGETVLGDRDELTQVFINLLHNSIKYGREGGTVHVSLRRKQSRPGSSIEISIEDDGPGIPSQHLPRLTERFYRVPSQAAQEKGGTGLGLAIVKHVLNRHRAELRISSEEGAGSKFTVLLAEHTAPIHAP